MYSNVLISRLLPCWILRSHLISPSHWPLLINSRVLFVNYNSEGNLCSGLTSVDWGHTVGVCSEPRRGYGYDHNSVQTSLRLLELQPEHLSRTALMVIGLCKTRGTGQVPHTHCLSTLINSVESSLARVCAEGCGAQGSAFSWEDYTWPVHVQSLVSVSMYQTTPLTLQLCYS